MYEEDMIGYKVEITFWILSRCFSSVYIDNNALVV